LKTKTRGAAVQFLRRLRCPFCENAFRYLELHSGYGVLECHCDRWPVIDNIPIIQRAPVGYFEHTTGEARSQSAGHDELVRLLEAHQFEEALIRCLISPRSMPALSRLIGWSLSHSKIVLGLQQGFEKAALKNLLKRRVLLTATDVFEFLCDPNSPLGDTRDYFIYRFGQPRHLAALALIQSIPPAAEPVLDIACGAGHFDHYLQRRTHPVAVIGCDINFFQLWIAKHWVAPQSEFVCTDVRSGLPFADNAFSATICSDAYHYIEERRALLAEIERCAPGRPVVMTRVGNCNIGPNEGFESDLDGYIAEMPGAQVFHEYGLLRDYLQQRLPRPAIREEAREYKWLSFMWNAAPPSAPTEWAHAVGNLVLNPIYRTKWDSGELLLRYHFPSDWFAFENGQMLTYLPRRLRVKPEELRTPSEKLIRQTVMIGVPDRYNDESSDAPARRHPAAISGAAAVPPAELN
jgi:SAM-dependent methyltransferase